MAKKAATTTNIAMDKTASSAAAAPKKSPSREKKHLKAQAAGVAAAVEGFVQAIVNPAAESAAKPQEISDTMPETVEAPITENPAHAVSAKPAEPKTVSEKEIAILAYEFYLGRGGQNGSQADDWFRAEQTLRAGK